MVVLERIRTGDEGTFGRIVAGDVRVSVVELPWRDNARSISCIPEGRYTLYPHHSPRFKRCLAVGEVPDRSHILIHAGNLAGDTTLGWYTHSRGCLLPGIRFGSLVVKGRKQDAVLSSRAALRALLAAVPEPTTLRIEDLC